MPVIEQIDIPSYKGDDRRHGGVGILPAGQVERRGSGIQGHPERAKVSVEVPEGTSLADGEFERIEAALKALDDDYARTLVLSNAQSFKPSTLGGNQSYGIQPLAPSQKEYVSSPIVTPRAVPITEHAPREIMVKLTLHVHQDYPKAVKVGEEKDGSPITRVVNSPKEEADLKLVGKEPAPQPEPIVDQLSKGVVQKGVA